MNPFTALSLISASPNQDLKSLVNFMVPIMNNSVPVTLERTHALAQSNEINSSSLLSTPSLNSASLQNLTSENLLSQQAKSLGLFGISMYGVDPKSSALLSSILISKTNLPNINKPLGPAVEQGQLNLLTKPGKESSHQEKLPVKSKKIDSKLTSNNEANSALKQEINIQPTLQTDSNMSKVTPTPLSVQNISPSNLVNKVASIRYLDEIKPANNNHKPKELRRLPGQSKIKRLKIEEEKDAKKKTGNVSQEDYESESEETEDESDEESKEELFKPTKHCYYVAKKTIKEVRVQPSRTTSKQEGSPPPQKTEMEILCDLTTELEPLLGFKEINQTRLFEILRKSEMNAQSVLVKIRSNANYYRRILKSE